jgi:hypothetical protein
MDRLRTFRDRVESDSEIEGVKVSLYAAIDIAVKDATRLRNITSEPKG